MLIQQMKQLYMRILHKNKSDRCKILIQFLPGVFGYGGKTIWQ